MTNHTHGQRQNQDTHKLNLFHLQYKLKMCQTILNSDSKAIPKWWVSSLSFKFSVKLAGETFLLESSLTFRSLRLDTSLSSPEPTAISKTHGSKIKVILLFLMTVLIGHSDITITQ